MKNVIYFILFLLALVSCKGTPMTMTGDPSKIVYIPEQLEVSFYNNVVEYGILPLETNEKSMLSEIEKIRIYNGIIYILSGRSNLKLLAFRKDGSFIGQIGLKGRGPKEYVELYNFEIDPTRDELLLLDRNGQKILIHDLDGNFRQSVSIPSAPECVGRLPNGNIVLSYVGSQLSLNEYHVIAVCDEKGKLLERQIENKINTSINISAKEMMTAMDDGNLSLMPQYHNIIYHVTNDGVIANFGFEIPGETIVIDNFKQEFKDLTSFMNALKGKNFMFGEHMETHTHIFFYNKGLGNQEHIFYNKMNEESLRVMHPLFGTSIFIDPEGYCWSGINETNLVFSEKGDDELTNVFLEAFEKHENIPLIYYKLKI